MTIVGRPLHQNELSDIADLLSAAGLPTDDIGDSGRVFFRFEDEAGLIGFGGWEGSGPDRLLRSILVVSARQRKGLGHAVVTILEAEARAAGAERLHLLTTSAADFFRKRAYREADRDGAPPCIRATREFSSLCPASARYLVKRLADGEGAARLSQLPRKARAAVRK